MKKYRHTWKITSKGDILAGGDLPIFTHRQPRTKEEVVDSIQRILRRSWEKCEEIAIKIIPDE